MSDSYQAVFDATRLSLRNTDVGAAIREACSLDASSAIFSLQQDFSAVAAEMQRPSAVFRPGLSIDGNRWCALYGENLQAGVAGFGDSPALAMEAFDKAWHEQLPQNGSAQ